MELRRRLYTRGSSYETTIPKPLLFALDLEKKHLVTFTYDDERQRWYLAFREADDPCTSSTVLPDPDVRGTEGG